MEVKYSESFEGSVGFPVEVVEIDLLPLSSGEEKLIEKIGEKLIGRGLQVRISRSDNSGILFRFFPR